LQSIKTKGRSDAPVLIFGPRGSDLSTSIESAASPPDLLSALGKFAAAVCFIRLCAFDGHFAARLFQRGLCSFRAATASSWDLPE
jgi:hypothetical protein